MKKKLIILFLFAGAVFSTLSAQIYDQDGQYVDTVFHDHVNRQAEDFVKASLVVAEPGGALYSIFGHACLHLQCDAFGLDYIFSYEGEDASSQLLLFIAGKLKMGLTAVPFSEYVNTYASEGREVVEYPLLFSPLDKQKLWEILDQYVNQGMNLPYDFEKRGCSYTCYKFVSNALAPKKITYAPWEDKFNRNRREICFDYTVKNFPWNIWFLMTLVGSKGDEELPPQEKLVIPTDLVEVWSKASIDGHALLGDAHIVSASTQAPYNQILFTPVMAAVLLLLLVIIGWKFHFVYADYIVLTICTLLGLMVSYLVIFSTLPCTDWNWLIIPLNPLPVIFWHWRKYWGAYYAGLIGLWLLAMLLMPHRQVDPANIVLIITLAIVYLKQSKLLPSAQH